MSYVKSLRALVLLAPLTALGCTSSDSSSSPPAPGDSLPALHAVIDGVEPGRIVDSNGREVLLRGVNVNTHVDYWQYDPDLFTSYPFTEADADLVAGMGWNMVRLLLSWSRVEPSPGEYDDAYLDEYAKSAALLSERGIYTLVDLHQDAWGASLVAPPDEVCPDSRPAGGWDGAPDWATFDDDEPRCDRAARELVPAVRAAWINFFNNREGPGGVGIQTRYVEMFAHIVKRFANDDSIAGYDLMNEPNQFLRENETKLSQFYEDALQAMREAEAEVGAPKRLFFFESSIAWNALGFPAPPPFEHDDQVVFSPHIYQEGIDPGTLEEGFAKAAEETVRLYGGAPVVTSEWGGDPWRVEDSEDDYFQRHLREQDNYLFGATIWTWHTACGDPHAYGAARAGQVPRVWGFFNQDCATNTFDGMRTEYLELIRKMALRFAPGPLSEVDWSPDDTELSASGDDAPSGNRLEVFVPTDDPALVQVEATGLGAVESVPWFDGMLFRARADGGPWSIRLTQAAP